MGTKYSSQSVSGYNATPPADDGSTTAANQVKWATVKSKIGDPLNTFASDIDSALTTALNYAAATKTADYSMVAGDNGKTIVIGSTVTTAITIKLPDAATAGAGWYSRIKNLSSVSCVIGRTTSSDTIDSIADGIGINPGELVDVYTDAAATGYVRDTGGNPTGTVLAFAGSSAPSGYLLCNGAAVSRTTYARLFAVISTTYGVGDGSTTFNVPDCTGRVVAGKEASSTRLTSTYGPDGETLGATGGAQSHTLTEDEMPTHTHTVSYTAVAVTAGGVVINSGSGASTFASGSAGSGDAHSIVQPTIILNYLIKT